MNRIDLIRRAARVPAVRRVGRSVPDGRALAPAVLMALVLGFVGPPAAAEPAAAEPAARLNAQGGEAAKPAAVTAPAAASPSPSALPVGSADAAADPDGLRGTGDLGVVIERASGSVLVVDQSERAAICRVEGLGDLSHAALTFSPDERYAFVFGRDGGLTRLDILGCRIDRRIVQAGNSIGGAISDDGRLVAVSNYEPGGVKVFDAQTLAQVADIPLGGKTVGLADLPGSRFVVANWDRGAADVIDLSGDPAHPVVTQLTGIGSNPYDGVMVDGRHYLVGLFGEKGLARIDLWVEPPQVDRVLEGYGTDQPDLPVYKMPHLQGWTLTGAQYALPAVGLHQVLWADAASGREVGRTDVAGQPVFVTARPDGREVWVNFAPPGNDRVQIIDTVSHRVLAALTPGKGVLHMEFTPRGREVWMSVRDEDKIVIYDSRSREKLAEIAARAPSGIFFTDRAHHSGL